MSVIKVARKSVLVNRLPLLLETDQTAFCSIYQAWMKFLYAAKFRLIGLATINKDRGNKFFLNISGIQAALVRQELT